MAVYIVFTRECTRDASELSTYTPKARASIRGHAVTVRSAYGPHEVLEGPPVEGVYIMEFPSFDEAKLWYDSPAYRDAREHRFKGAGLSRDDRPGGVRLKTAQIIPKQI